ncbi:MAG: hypothetical protein NDJ90_00660 [Oligoflexia bacterium]|nr:hypothetical protein [Oligoflexia bacterium]
MRKISSKSGVLFAFAALLITTPALAQTLGSEFVRLDHAVGSGLYLEATRPLRFELGAEQEFYVQNGKTVTKDGLAQKTPYCKVTLDSAIRNEITHFSFNEGQPLLVMQIARPKGLLSLFGRDNGLSIFQIQAVGTFEDAKAVMKKGSTTPPVDAESRIGMQSLQFDCAEFPASASVGDLQKTLGEEKFRLVRKEANVDVLLMRSSLYKERKAKEAAAKAAEKEKAVTEERAAAGKRADASTSLKSLVTGDSVFIDGSLLAKDPKGPYAGSVFQGGDRIGAIDKQGQMFQYKGKNLDLLKPYCSLLPQLFRRAEGDITIGKGRYDVSRIELRDEHGVMAILKGTGPAANGTSPEIAIVCSNVTTTADIEKAIGPAWNFYVKDAKAAIDSSLEQLEAVPALTRPSSSGDSSVAETKSKDLNEPAVGGPPAPSAPEPAAAGAAK